MKPVLLLGAAAGALIAQGAAAQTSDLPDVERIIVQSSPLGQSLGEAILSTTVLSQEELERRVSSSIGETLRREAGVSSTFFGPGSSRPVIRGLSGDRIRVLDSGIGSIDASATSDDHAVAVESALAERIEIIRGTATLLYGSSAAGGVVNVFDGRIPDSLPENGLEAGARYQHSTADNGDEVAGAVNAKLWSFGAGDVVLHLDGFKRNTDDYEIPGFAESAALRAAEEAEEEGEEHEEEEEAFGVVENTDIDSEGGAFGLSYIFDRGFFGFSGKLVDANYGVPGGHGHEEEEGHEEDEEEEEEESVRIDLDQVRYDIRGEIDGDWGWFEKARIRVGYANYKHKELEGPDEVGTVFANEGWEGRFELREKPVALGAGDLKGAIGVHWRLRDFSAVGAEAFVPPTDSSQIGIFALKEYDAGIWHLEGGARYEHTKHEAAVSGVEREFDAFSISGGLGLRPADGVFTGVTVFRTERAPATEELFSNGPHLATNAFEVGNIDLNKEKAVGVEGIFRYTTDRFVLSVNGYYTNYNDFITLVPTGMEEDDLPVFEFQAFDAEFAGMEIQGELEMGKIGAFDIHGDATFDFVDARADGSGNGNLPRIPPVSSIVGVEAQSNFIDVRMEGEFAGDKVDFAEFELPTDGYKIFNAFLTLRPFGFDSPIAVDIKAENITDEDARLHTSFLKDIAPLPGRNIKFAVRGRF
ncbi:MAG: TonB-dependent receptor [Parvularculaceae bacterium]